MEETTSLKMTGLLGDGPFVEIGVPTTVAVAEHHGVVCVGGDLGLARWPGFALPPHYELRARVGVYELHGVECRHVIPSRWPVRTIAVHPTLQLAVVGTGHAINSPRTEGELFIVDLRTGETTELMSTWRTIRHVRWRDDQTLDVIANSGPEHPSTTGHGVRARVHRGDWSEPENWHVDDAEFARGVSDETVEVCDQDAAHRRIIDLCRANGLAWIPRRHVWAVEGTSDGRILSTLHGTTLECWNPSGELAWSIPSEFGGRQLHVLPDERSARVNVMRPRNRNSDVASAMVDVSLNGGRIRATRKFGSPVSLVVRQDGWLAVRDVGRRYIEPATILFSPDRSEAGRVTLGRATPSERLPVRHSRELLFVQTVPPDLVGEAEPEATSGVTFDEDDGADEQGSVDHRNDLSTIPLRRNDERWIVAVTPAEKDEDGDVAQLRRLFRLDFAPDANMPLSGGPMVHIGRGVDQALVHAGARGHGWRKPAFIVRRRLPDGAAEWLWEDPRSSVVTALDGSERCIVAAFLDGVLLVLDAASGEERGRFSLHVRGVRVVPLSLSLDQEDTVLVGTMDGRILRLDLPETVSP